MDTNTLVNEQIQTGGQLIRHLSQNGFEVTAAFWLQPSGDSKWRFYVVSPAAESEGLAKAYSRLHTLIRPLTQPFSIAPLSVRLIGPSDPIAQEILAIYKSVSEPQSAPFPWMGRRLGSMSIEGAFLYPLSVAAAP